MFIIGEKVSKKEVHEMILMRDTDENGRVYEEGFKKMIRGSMIIPIG